MSSIDLAGKKLKTLKGQKISEVINGHFICKNNKLTSLEFGPKEINDGQFNCVDNLLTSLEYCPSKIGHCLFAHYNSVTNLKDIHKQFKDGYIGDHLSLINNPLKSHLLGVILIPELQFILTDKISVQDIINKHLRTRDVLECQEELIQNGFKEFAKL